MKKENGITIVALSVTIIVLLILAGISIKLVLDNNGIIGNAQTAKNQYTESEANTEQGIGELSNVLSSNLNHNRNNGTNTTTNTVDPTPEPTKYTLTINAGAGTATGSTSVQGTSGSTVTVSNPTPPSGYTVTLNGNNGTIGTSSTASLKTTYSFSRWNLSGGGSLSGTTYTFGNSNGTLTAQYTHTGRSLPTPDRSGYTFKGWYTATSGGTKVGDAGTVYTPTSNVTIYAQWEKNVVTSKVTLNVGNGTANSDTSFQGDSGTSITITNPTVPSAYVLYLENNDGSYSSTTLRSSFTFSGWSLSGGGSISGSTYTFGDTDGTLTAQYTQSGITLTKPTRTGYTLKGWYTASSGGTKVGNGGDVYKPSANGTTLYAQWEQNASTQYTLTVNAGAGTATSSTSIQGTSGSTVTISNPTPPSGYTITFNANNGYCSTSRLTTSYSFNGWTLTSGYGSISGQTYTFGNGNGTITASYYQNGAYLPTATRSGYTFKGWYTYSSGGSKAGSAGEYYYPSSNITLYAQWEQVSSVPDLTSSNTTFRPSTTNWTNEYVTVSVSTTVSGYTLQTTKGNPTVESNWANTAYVTATSNCTVYARLTNGSTSGNYTSYNVGNIDKTPPDVMTKTNLTINKNTQKNTGQLIISNMKDNGDLGTVESGSGVARVECYYKFNGDTSYTYLDLCEYVPINGSERGRDLCTYNFIVTSSKITSSATGTLYMYVIIYDAAGNSTKSYIASIDLSTGSTNYQEEVVSYTPIFTPSTTAYMTDANGASVTVTVTSPVSGYYVQTTTLDPTVSSNWSNTTTRTFSQNGTLYARLTNGSTTYDYVAYNVTNIASSAYSYGKGMVTISRNNTLNKVYMQLNSLRCDSSGIKKFILYYRTDESEMYKFVEFDASSSPIQPGGSYRVEVQDADFAGKKIYAYTTGIPVSSTGSYTSTVECTISADGGTTTVGQ